MNANKQILVLYCIALIGLPSLCVGQEEDLLLIFPKQLQWINPASIGLEKETNLGLLINSKWLGIKDAPKQQTLFYESFSGKKNINFGGLIRNQSRFAENSIQFFGKFSFPIKLNSFVELHLGIHGGGEFSELNFDYLHSVDGVIIDPLLQKQTHFTPNLGVGFHLKISNYSIQGSFPKLLERFAFQKIFQLSIPNRLYFFSEVEWSQKSILKSNLLKVTLQYHNLGINKNTAQVKARHIFRFGEIYLGINSKKNMGIGFLFDTKKILSIGYAFQFPIAVSSDLKLNNHSIYLQFNIKKIAQKIQIYDKTYVS